MYHKMNHIAWVAGFCDISKKLLQSDIKKNNRTQYEYTRKQISDTIHSENMNVITQTSHNHSRDEKESPNFGKGNDCEDGCSNLDE